MESNLLIERFTAAELLACAVCRLFPDAKLLSGGANELGFFYDFVLEAPLDQSFIPMIEEAMRAIAKEAHAVGKREMMRENAADFFAHRQQFLKAELILAFPCNIIELIEFAGFFDVAPSYYTQATSEVGIFKLLDVSSVTRFDAGQGGLPALRITGEVFADKQQLKQYIKLLKSDKECGHQALVEAMELYSFDAKASELSGFWLPKGLSLRQTVLNLWRDGLLKSGIQEVAAPQWVRAQFLRKAPWLSGFLELEWADDYYVMSESPVFMHSSLFKSKPRYEGELPLRFAEFKEVCIDPQFSSLEAGMLKTPSQSVGFVHSFCNSDQLHAELISSLHFIEKMVTILGLRCQWSLLINKEKSAGTSKQWDQTLGLMRKALEFCACNYIEDPYDQAINGPQLKGYFQDRLGRKWCGPELGVDLILPAKLELFYSDSKGQKARPSLVWQKTLGPLERLIALLVEKYNGELPLWLAPEQVRVIGLGDGEQKYAHEVLCQLQQAGIRAAGDFRSQSLGCSLGLKVHECECARVPYALIIGEKEENERIVNVRKCGQKAASLKMNINDFLQELSQRADILPPSGAALQRGTETINRSHERV